MKTLEEIKQRVIVCESRKNYGSGYMMLITSGKNKTASVVWSIDNDFDDVKWEHVSVALPSRDPLWSEMCEVKDTFFYDEEECIEFHPKKSEYVNLHPHCLHIWRRIDCLIGSPVLRMSEEVQKNG